MKAHLVLLLALACIATPAMATCQLDRDDFAALRLSPSGIQNQQTVDRLPADEQSHICMTRDVLKKLRKANNEFTGKTMPQFWAAYLAPNEKAIVVQASKAWLFKNVIKQ